MAQRSSTRAANAAAAPVAVSAPSRASIVGPWRRFGLLGQGQLTEVYAASPGNDPNDGRPDYALKLLRPQWSEDREAIACLQREALVGSRVSHPRLISILSASVSQPPYYLVMPKLVGWPLPAWISGRRLSVTMCLCVARQVAEALGALHAAGWMHADVKPGNVFLSPQGHATLLDLGFARRRDDTRSLLCRPVLGTPTYMAPEAFTSATAPDIRSDFYSLGVMLFELLSGMPPFTGDEPSLLATQQLSSRPPELRRIMPLLPIEVTRLVDDLLAKESLRRPQTPEELIQRLVGLEILTFTDRRSP